MKLVIFGATGGTGQQLIQQAVSAGHSVTAVARNAEGINIPAGQGTVKPGNVLDASAVENAVSGSDAVIWAIGTGPNPMKGRRPTTLFSAGMTNVIKAMQRQNVDRLMVVSSAATVPNPTEPAFFKFVFKPLLQETYKDMRRMELAVQASDRKWTVVRALYLNNGPQTNKFRVSRDTPPAGAWQLSRADLAQFILSQLNSDEYVRGFVTIGY